MSLITIKKNRYGKDAHISLEFTNEKNWKVLSFNPINYDDIIGETEDDKTEDRLKNRKKVFGTMDLTGSSPEAKILESKLKEGMGFSSLYIYVFLTAMGTYENLSLELAGINPENAKKLLREMGKKS